jgi:preprotein translocase subunit SecD
LAFLTVFAAAALIIMLITPDKPAGSAIDWHGGTRVTLTAHTFDGSPATPDALSKAQRVIRSRVSGLGFAHPQIDAAGDTLTVTVPGNHPEELRSLGQAGQLHIRPVLNALPAAPGWSRRSGPARTPPQPKNQHDLEHRIATEKKLRQSTSQAIQLLALQLEATRCDKPDILADNDNPYLPLVTCSTDHQVAYLLAPSIISGSQIQDAHSGFNPGSGTYAVDLQFNSEATRAWAEFTAAHIGGQAAFTVDSQVISAPQIRHAIRSGKTQMPSGQIPFTADSAHHLANTLKYGSLPLSFAASEPETIAPKAVTAVHERKRYATWPVITTGALLAALLCTQAFLYRTSIRGLLSARR